MDKQEEINHHMELLKKNYVSIVPPGLVDKICEIMENNGYNYIKSHNEESDYYVIRNKGV